MLSWLLLFVVAVVVVVVVAAVVAVVVAAVVAVVVAVGIATVVAAGIAGVRFAVSITLQAGRHQLVLGAGAPLRLAAGVEGRELAEERHRDVLPSDGAAGWTAGWRGSGARFRHVFKVTFRVSIEGGELAEERHRDALPSDGAVGRTLAYCDVMPHLCTCIRMCSNCTW